MSGIPTSNIVTVASTYYITTYSEEELKTSNHVWGLYVNLLEFYVNEKLSLNLSCLNGWSGTPRSDIEDLVQSEKAFIITSALMANYNFRVRHYSNEAGEGNTYRYIGIGPTLIQANKMEASATLNDGTEREVSATYSAAPGLAIQIGTKVVGRNKGRKSFQGNIGARFGIPFSKMPVDQLTVKENGAEVPVNKEDMHLVSPMYFMIFCNLDIGWL